MTPTHPLNNKRGQGLSEYLILLLLVAITAIGVTKSFGKVIYDKIQLATRHVESEVRIADFNNSK